MRAPGLLLILFCCSGVVRIAAASPIDSLLEIDTTVTRTNIGCVITNSDTGSEICTETGTFTIINDSVNQYVAGFEVDSYPIPDPTGAGINTSGLPLLDGWSAQFVGATDTSGGFIYTAGSGGLSGDLAPGTSTDAFTWTASYMGVAAGYNIMDPDYSIQVIDANGNPGACGGSFTGPFTDVQNRSLGCSSTYPQAPEPEASTTIGLGLFLIGLFGRRICLRRPPGDRRS